MKEEILEQLRKITAEEQKLLQEGEKRIQKELYTSSEEFTVDSEKMLEKGKLITIRTHTRFAAFPNHSHNFIEIMYMCSGKTVHRINHTSEVVLQTGDLLFLGQNSCHEIQAAGVEDIGINFMILPRFFDEILGMIGEESVLSNFLVDTLKKSGGSGFLHYRVADILPIQNLIENLVWSLLSRQSHANQINQLTMGLLFAQLVRVTERIEGSSGEQEQMFVMEVFRYIEEHYRDASLSEFAAARNTSVSAVSRRIRRAAGKTFKELLQEKRLKQAEYLLVHTQLPVTDIIYRVGYDNTSYFHRIFLRQYGVSPWKFRNVGNN